MISIQTNVTSLEAQANLNTNNNFQSNTIQQLTSGYRINSSGDDAAGLAVANGYQANISELTQGVMNANDGTSQLQIVDGGLSNISTILNRMQTLATESASGTFTGSRATLNQEYSGLVTEITRQASNIGLNAGGALNANLNVFIGGAGKNVSNASVNVDLSGANNAVDATSLGLSGSNVLAGGVGLTGNTANLNGAGATFVVGTSAADNQSFVFNVTNASGVSSQVIATVAATTTGSTLSSVLNSLNGQLSASGITASTNSTGQLEFSGSGAFTVADGGGGTFVSGNATAAGLVSAGTQLLTSNLLVGQDGAGVGEAVNTSNFNVAGKPVFGTLGTSTAASSLTFSSGSGQATVAIASGQTLAQAITTINAATNSIGVNAVLNADGTGISFQGATTFAVSSSAAAQAFTATGAQTVTAAVGSATANATSAITAINAAIQSLGLVQGSVGAGENTLQYATNLAQSQITNYSSAESSIRDADIAAQAANLTKAQVLIQTSVAALAQANSAPQAILKLLQ
jgi:flagellin